KRCAARGCRDTRPSPANACSIPRDARTCWCSFLTQYLHFPFSVLRSSFQRSWKTEERRTENGESLPRFYLHEVVAPLVGPRAKNVVGGVSGELGCADLQGAQRIEDAATHRGGVEDQLAAGHLHRALDDGDAAAEEAGGVADQISVGHRQHAPLVVEAAAGEGGVEVQVAIADRHRAEVVIDAAADAASGILVQLAIEDVHDQARKAVDAAAVPIGGVMDQG